MDNGTVSRHTATTASGRANVPIQRASASAGTMPSKAVPKRIAQQNGSTPKSGGTGGNSNGKGSKRIIYALVAAICVLAVVLGVWGIRYYAYLQEKKLLDAQWAQYEEELLANQGIAHGVFIDGVNIGGMTQEQAIEAVEKTHQEFINNAKVQISYEQQRFTVDSTVVPVRYNTQQLVEQAFAVGREGTREERLDTIRQHLEAPLQLTTDYTFDTSGIASFVQKLAGQIDQEPKDAKVLSFDPHPSNEADRFKFEEGQDGLLLDQLQLISAVEQAYQQERFGTAVVANVKLTPQKMTLEMLQNATQLIATASTKAANNANRNQNIRQCADSFDGRILMPGEVFSINESTGPRTLKTGYKPAGAIVSGILIDEPGGGVCQVSGTLYNAVLMADLEIVERYHHSWPSSYMPKALDASINYGTADFRFRNNRETPIYISHTFKDQKLEYKLYGAPLEDGVTITLHSEVVSTKESPAPRTVVNNDLLPGQQRTKKHSMAGYTVNAFRTLHDKDGNVIKTEKMYTDVYAPQVGIIEVGPEAPETVLPVDPNSPQIPPTDPQTPEPTPTPTTTPAQPTPEPTPPQETQEPQDEQFPVDNNQGDQQ